MPISATQISSKREGDNIDNIDNFDNIGKLYMSERFKNARRFNGKQHGVRDISLGPWLLTFAK